jgi:hypothetical protein
VPPVIQPGLESRRGPPLFLRSVSIAFLKAGRFGRLRASLATAGRQIDCLFGVGQLSSKSKRPSVVPPMRFWVSLEGRGESAVPLRRLRAQALPARRWVSWERAAAPARGARRREALAGPVALSQPPSAAQVGQPTPSCHGAERRQR